jgi:hypothetical protein
MPPETKYANTRSGQEQNAPSPKTSGANEIIFHRAAPPSAYTASTHARNTISSVNGPYTPRVN